MRGSHCLMSLDPVWEPWAGFTPRGGCVCASRLPSGECCGGRALPQAEHREDGGIVRAYGFREPVWYGVEITEYPVVKARAPGAPKESGRCIWTDKHLLNQQRSDYGEIGVVADLFGLPEVPAVVSGHVCQEGAQRHFGPLERPWSLRSGQVEAVRFLNELG